MQRPHVGTGTMITIKKYIILDVLGIIHCNLFHHFHFTLMLMFTIDLYLSLSKVYLQPKGRD